MAWFAAGSRPGACGRLARRGLADGADRRRRRLRGGVQRRRPVWRRL